MLGNFDLSIDNFYYIAVITTAGGNKKTVLCRDNKYYKTEAGT